MVLGLNQQQQQQQQAILQSRATMLFVYFCVKARSRPEWQHPLNPWEPRHTLPTP